MKKSIQKTQINGVVFFSLDRYEDNRGWLVELFRNDCLHSTNYPVMSYVSQTKPGVVRGPHEHKCQSDLFCFIGPGDFEFILWEKSGLKDYYEERHLLGESNPVAVIVPPGVVHAYKNISDYPGVVYNFPNYLFGGPGKCYSVDEIRHEEDSATYFVI
jgi:dTDP-4-dehydrorhamnose 3,5-epimerase